MKKNNIVFVSNSHERFYNTYATKLKVWEPKQRAFFYLMGISKETRNRIEQVYDFDKNRYKAAALFLDWSYNVAVTVRLAFNLWDGWTQTNRMEMSTPYNLFDCSIAPYFVQSLSLRFPHRFRMAG